MCPAVCFLGKRKKIARPWSQKLETCWSKVASCLKAGLAGGVSKKCVWQCGCFKEWRHCQKAGWDRGEPRGDSEGSATAQDSWQVFHNDLNLSPYKQQWTLPFFQSQAQSSQAISPICAGTLGCSGMSCSPSHSLGQALQQWVTAALHTALNIMSRMKP